MQLHSGDLGTEPPGPGYPDPTSEDVRELAREIFAEIIAVMQSGARRIRPIDAEQAAALLQDSIHLTTRCERLSHRLYERAKHSVRREGLAALAANNNHK